MEELDIELESLQYYDVQHRQWVTCSLSFPHHVKHNGRLLLRHRDVSCADLTEYIDQSTAKLPHHWENMTGNRTAIRMQQKQKKNVRASPSDRDEVEFVEPEFQLPSQKHGLDEEEDCSRPSQQMQLMSPSTPNSTIRTASHLSPSSSPMIASSPFVRSPSLVVSSPYPILKPDILVPDSTKPWPDGMYTRDMAAAFLAVDDRALKKRFRRLEDCIRELLKKDVHCNTWNNQRRHWNAATEEEHNMFINAGHTSDGLWAKFPKAPRV